jgi:hypothetical protein
MMRMLLIIASLALSLWAPARAADVESFVSACVLQGGTIRQRLGRERGHVNMSCELRTGETHQCIYDATSDTCAGATAPPGSDTAVADGPKV